MTRNPKIDTLRIFIDKFNHQLLALINKRAETAVEIGKIKRLHNLPISDLKRESLIVSAMAAKNPGPLDEKAVRSIFKLLIKETKRIEREHSLEPLTKTGKKHSRNH